MTKPITCATLIQYYDKILCCHVTNQTHWDLPKGMCDANEELADAAVREVREETGIIIPCDPTSVIAKNPLIFICQGKYNQEKDIALFGYKSTEEFKFLRCTSMFTLNGVEYPEVDDFEWVSHMEFYIRTSKSMKNFLYTNGNLVTKFLFNY